MAKVARDKYMEELDAKVSGIRFCKQQGIRHGGSLRGLRTIGISDSQAEFPEEVRERIRKHGT